MKEYIQKAGVRPWHGDELVALQNEPLDALQNFFKQFRPFILEGVKSSGSGPYSISSGLVTMEHPTDGYKIVRFTGLTGTPGNGLLYINKTVTTKLYNDGNNHDALYDYTAVYIDAADPGYTSLDVSLTASQKIYIFNDGSGPYESFVRSLREGSLGAWTSVTNPILTPGVFSAISIEKRRDDLTGMMHVRGTITMTPTASTGLLPRRVAVVALDAAEAPDTSEYFVAAMEINFLTGTYKKEFTGLDYITNISGAVGFDGIIYLYPLSAVSGGYNVHFKHSYYII